MGKATRSKINMEHMEEAIAKLASNQLHVTSKLDDLIQRITMLESNQHHSPAPSSSSANPQTPSRSSSFPRMKLEVPRFDGSDPSGWTFKINQFFDCHSTPEPERLVVSSFAMEGLALAWFQWLIRSGQVSSWIGLLHALEARFAPSQYEDPTGSLCKLTQQGSVSAYLSQFEMLANRIIGLLAPFLLSCFMSGLAPEIRREVQALHPLTLVQAMGLARLQEEKLADQHRGAYDGPCTCNPNPISTLLLPLPPTSPLLPSRAKPPPPHVRRLSSEEITMRREKGLCFKCDEKFTRGHKCSSRRP